MRIAIAGVPRAGKSTFALQLARATGFSVVHADDFIPLGWSEASDEVARRLWTPGPYILEGVAVTRGLRKALDIGPDRPCDRVHWLGESREPHSAGQARMAAADRTRFADMRAELERRGVQVIDGAGGESLPRAIDRTPTPAAPVPTAQPAAVQAQESSPFIHQSESRWSGAPGRGFG